MKTIVFRTTPETHAAWASQAQAAGLSLTDWIRARLDATDQQTGLPSPGRGPSRRTWTPVDPLLLRQLVAIENGMADIRKHHRC